MNHLNPSYPAPLCPRCGWRGISCVCRTPLSAISSDRVPTPSLSRAQQSATSLPPCVRCEAYAEEQALHDQMYADLSEAVPFAIEELEHAAGILERQEHHALAANRRLAAATLRQWFTED